MPYLLIINNTSFILWHSRDIFYFILLFILWFLSLIKGKGVKDNN